MPQPVLHMAATAGKASGAAASLMKELGNALKSEGANLARKVKVQKDFCKLR